jgi:solute carrier family 9B (sodium/hydrogen exchanger), member 1/2
MMSGGGTLAVVVVGIVVNDKMKTESKPVQELLAVFWARYGQPFLFGLLGAAVNLESLTPSVVLGGCLLVFCGLLLRSAACFLCTLTTDWNFKEKMFACITWCPKATVQV